MAEGRITEYIDQRKIVLSVCLKDKGSKLQLLTVSNHEVSISPKRALLVSSLSLDISHSREELLRKLKEIEMRRMDFMKVVSVPDLWELTHEENDTFSYKYLAQLVFGEPVTDDHISALVRALFADSVYFKMKDDYFIPNTAEKVEQIKKAREAAELRDREITEGANWLKELVNGRNPAAPPLKEKIVETMIQLALHGKDAPDFKVGKEMFSRAGIKDINQARHVLVKLNIWDEDENLDIHRFRIRVGFNDSVTQAADLESQKELDLSGREDLRDLAVFTIDGPFTKDFDDALSLDAIDGGYRLGVHITDLTPFIEIEGPLDREASARASSIYLPATQIPMFPPTLSNNTLSLLKGSDRLTISLLADFGKAWELRQYRFVPSIVRIREQLTYEQVNGLLNDEPIFSSLHELSQALRQRRADAGGLIIPLPEIHFEFENSPDFKIYLVEQDTPAKIMVSESMILYNWLAAKYASEAQLPLIYRSQEPPQERLLIDETNYIYCVFQQRRKLHPVLVDTLAHQHSGLGVDLYTNATSPLRRYIDLLVQRQIHAALFGQPPPYSESELKEHNLQIQQTLRDIEVMKRNQIRYWILKYLAGRRNMRFNALVFQKLRTKYLVILAEFLFVAELPMVSGRELSPGEQIGVVVKKSDPWEDLLSLELAD
jgi:exoribonuclease-2